MLYAGTYYGNIWIRQKKEGKWEKISENIPEQLVPAMRYVSHIAASRHEAGRVYVTLTGRYDDDLATYALASEDYGETWVSIADGLPGMESANIIIEDLDNEDMLFLGTDLGIYITLDRGKTWHSLQGSNVPNVSIQDMKIHPKTQELLLATFGRGIYLLPLESIRNVATGQE
jgi:hypothetical protein